MIIFFLIWLETTWVPPSPNPPPAEDKPFPWFFLPLCIFAVPLVIGHVRNTYQEYRYWVHISITLVILNIMLFFIWGFQDSQVPWYGHMFLPFTLERFLFVWLITGLGIGFVWWRYKKTGDGATYGGAYVPDTSSSASPGFSSPYTPVSSVSSVSYQSPAGSYQTSVTIPEAPVGGYQGSYQETATGEESDRAYESI